MLSQRARIAAYISVFAYSLVVALSGVQLPSALGRIISAIPLVVSLLFLLFDKLLWRASVVPKLVRRPDVRGTWLGELVSYRRDENDTRITSTHSVAIVIRQDFLTLSVTLLSAESKSTSAAAQINRIQDGDYVLMYQYQNTPRMAFRDESPIHTGGSTIEINGEHPDQLDGEYWTARESRGTYQVTRVSRNIAGTFEESRKMKGSS